MSFWSWRKKGGGRPCSSQATWATTTGRSCGIRRRPPKPSTAFPPTPARRNFSPGTAGSALPSAPSWSTASRRRCITSRRSSKIPERKCPHRIRALRCDALFQGESDLGPVRVAPPSPLSAQRPLRSADFHHIQADIDRVFITRPGDDGHDLLEDRLGPIMAR